MGGCHGALILCGAIAGMTLGAGPALAQSESRERPFTVRWSVKGTGVFSETSQAGLWRLRIEPGLRLGPRVTFDLAYEHRVRLTSDAAKSPGATGSTGSGLDLLPSEASAPYRVAAGDWEIASGERVVWRHEVDRAALHVQAARIGITAGRQAVGWGRGVLFGALDLFAPFSPFEADREWRRGADVLRVDARISGRSSADVVLAFGGRPAESAFAGRLRGYSGEVDLEVVGGRRGRDVFAGAATSFVIGPAEVHVEVAAFRTPATAASAIFGVPRTVAKVVAGGSSRLPIAEGLLLHAEYHYSGFGADGAREIAVSLRDREFRARVLRGDTQILTRHGVAVAASYEWSPLVAWSVSLVQEPVDGSGVVSPSIAFTFNDRWSLLASGYLPYGREAAGLATRSAYGDAPPTALIQVRCYR